MTSLKPSDFNKDSLQKIYGSNKEFIKGLELPALVALSHYPELKNTRISFKLKNIESTGKTTFTFFSLFTPYNKHFIIWINNNKSRTGFLLQEVSFNAQIGALGHELAHVADFMNRGTLNIAGWALRYLNKNHQREIERQIDLATIHHGLGWQLYDWTNTIMSNPALSIKYKEMRHRNYLRAEEIREEIEHPSE